MTLTVTQTTNGEIKPGAADLFLLSAETRAVVNDVRHRKHMAPGDNNWDGALSRVAATLFHDDETRAARYLALLQDGVSCPAGRIMAGAGSNKMVTWINCFVAAQLQDSMRSETGIPGVGIMDCLSQVAYSMQLGGGVGTDFSPLRPRGARVHKLDVMARGVLRFMSMWSEMSRTVTPSGFRDGAMMATLACDHPDLWNAEQYEKAGDGSFTAPSFISAKRQAGWLREFNLSILVSDAFMTARDRGDDWELGHWIEPYDLSTTIAIRERRHPVTGEQLPWYVYRKVPAQQLWHDVMTSTYKYAEPGVIFIDRINEHNNLYYCEDTRATNPCGEQPLPPHGCCDLAHINLARLVEHPFEPDAHINLSRLRETAALTVRALNAVLDLTPWPLPEQQQESISKRRIGIGVTGLGNALMFCQLRYGSPDALHWTGRVMRELRDACYLESIKLAKRDGPFPLFDAKKYCKSKFIATLPERIYSKIRDHGIRNSHLLTVAPVGTGSITQGENCSSGIEPVFLPRHRRGIKQPDGSLLEVQMEDLGFRVYANAKFDGDIEAMLEAPLPDYMVTAADLTPADHLSVLSVAQQYIDASVGKTINVPEHTAFDDFAGIYDKAYELNCKSCTTYRPDADSGRGAVLTPIAPISGLDGSLMQMATLRRRPEVLEGRTYRYRWADQSSYLTINDEVLSDGRRVPFEVFLVGQSVDSAHWISGLTRMISAVMRRDVDFSFLPDELMRVYSARGGEFIDGGYVTSEVALIGRLMKRHFIDVGYMQPEAEMSEIPDVQLTPAKPYAQLGAQCPKCGQPCVIRMEGCDSCINCEYSRCG